jgi:hypothetical protein
MTTHDVDAKTCHRGARKLALVAASLLGLLLAGCPDECYQEFGDRDCRFSQGQTRCGIGENLNSVEECQLDSGSGCHLWTESEACDGSLRCDPVEGACVCRNECSHIEGSTCVDNVIYVCEQDSQGCFIETSDDCGGRDLSCQMGAEGRHQCCRSDCQPGQGQCNGRVIEWCLIDETGCAEWTAYRDCSMVGETCEETDGGVGCTNTLDCDFGCWAGETRCVGDTVEHCVEDPVGCPRWELGTNCAESGQTCVSSAEGTWCSGSCTNACALGDAQCDGDVAQICVAGVGGCTEWQDGVDCAASGQSCLDGECTGGGCAECILGETQCADRIIQRCVAIAGDCTEWADETDCELTDEICNDFFEPAVCEIGGGL